jgi:hypothetical protein
MLSLPWPICCCNHGQKNFLDKVNRILPPNVPGNISYLFLPCLHSRDIGKVLVVRMASRSSPFFKSVRVGKEIKKVRRGNKLKKTRTEKNWQKNRRGIFLVYFSGNNTIAQLKSVLSTFLYLQLFGYQPEDVMAKI